MKKDWLILTLVFTLVTCIFYFYVALTTNAGLDNIYKSWDGPSYVVAALSLYRPDIAVNHNLIQSPDIRADFTFLPAHFPLYPLLIRLFSFVGYFRAAVGISLLFSLFTSFAMYELIRALKFSRPLLVTLPLLLFPPRWFVISHTGSSEPVFLFLLILSLLYFVKKRPWSSAIFAALAQLARPQGALLALGIFLVAVFELFRTSNLKTILHTYFPYLLIPLSLIGVFTFYYFQTGSFWAFFDAISIFHHFSFQLFPTFNFPAENIETFWQEINAVDYVLYLAAIITLLKTKALHNLGLIALPFFLSLLFLQHSDISRYALTLLPFAYLAFAPFLASLSFNLGLYLASPAIFRYAATFISLNRAT